MSIQRSDSSNSSRPSDVDKPREPDPRLRPQDKREAPNPETIDRFRTLMQAKQGPQQDGADPLRGNAMRELAQKADAQVAAQGGEDAAVAREAATAMAKDQAVTRKEEQQHGDGSDALPPADASLLWQAHMALRDVQTPAVAPPPVNSNVFAELIERHVRQLAVSGGVDGDGKVLLRLADSTLPGTDLLLSRTADGWLLRADVRSRSSFDAIRDAAPELTKRFADRNLGTLSIDPHFHG
jgi:hypothetical protein